MTLIKKYIGVNLKKKYKLIAITKLKVNLQASRCFCQIYKYPILLLTQGTISWRIDFGLYSFNKEIKYLLHLIL